MPIKHHHKPGSRAWKNRKRLEEMFAQEVIPVIERPNAKLKRIFSHARRMKKSARNRFMAHQRGRFGL